MKSQVSNRFFPKRIIIPNNADNSPKTLEVIERIHSSNPKTPVVSVKKISKAPGLKALSVQKRWRFRKESIILSERGEPFITTFASPGKIVEDIGTILNLTFHCASDCEFCYLQNVMPPDHKIHTNIERLESEIACEQYVHPAVLTLWTIISFGQKQSLLKIPKNFQRAAGYIRDQFQKHKVGNDKDAIRLLYSLLHDDNCRLFKCFLTKRERKYLFGPDSDPSKLGPDVLNQEYFDVSKKKVAEYYNKNKKYHPRLNTSEYTDFLAIEHLAGFLPHIMSLLHKYPTMQYGFRTKTANVAELLKYDGDNRVRVAINFNTQYVIDKYEHGTSSLKERLLAAKKIQKSKGINLKIVLEPIIYYDNYLSDYRKLIRTIVKSIDPSNVVDYTFATVRYGKKLMNRIKRNFPKTDLMNPKYQVDVAPGDTKWRYSEESREVLYKILKEEVLKVAPKAIIRLGAENPELWERVGLNQKKHIKKSVYQYPGKK